MSIYINTYSNAQHRADWTMCGIELAVYMYRHVTCVCLYNVCVYIQMCTYVRIHRLSQASHVNGRIVDIASKDIPIYIARIANFVLLRLLSLTSQNRIDISLGKFLYYPAMKGRYTNKQYTLMSNICIAT
jgi:hypothetical protein